MPGVGRYPEKCKEMSRSMCDLDFEQSTATPGANSNAKGPQIIKERRNQVQSA